VEVFLGNGDGTFQSPLTIDVGYESIAFAAGDFNRDGKLDLAVVDVCINSVNCQNGVASIFLGNGDGSFQAAKVTYVGASPNSIGVADFNGDSIVDLVVANSGKGRIDPGGVSFLSGVGDGSFLPSVTIKASTTPANLIVADFNGDGFQDFAVNNGTSLSVIFGGGNGMFAFPVTNPGTFGGAMVAADLNGDRKPDIAITQNAVEVLTGLGNGKFEAPILLLQNSGSIVVLPAVLGNDTLPDLVVGTQLSRPVTVVLNQTH
jgi:FG-GAP-like repeat